MTERIMITGATGFIGAHLTESSLKAGFEVHVLVRDADAKAFPEGVRRHVIENNSIESVFDCFSAARPNVVIHLASLFIAEHSPQHINPLIESNILFGTRILEAMREFDCHNMINTGTAWQHYQNEEYNPVCLYAATKEAFEKIITFYVEAHDFRVITLKLFDTYGPHDARKKLFYLLQNTDVNDVLQMSAGEQRMNLVHVYDVIRAYHIAVDILGKQIESGQKSYMVSAKNMITLKSLVELYQEVSGRKVRIEWGARPYRMREVMEPWSEGGALPGWEPKIELKKGLAMLETA